jgi:hypothetical protein
MDPFEVRMRFITLLKGLNASQASALKAAQLALKHKDMLEDLHSCILEQLEEVGEATVQRNGPANHPADSAVCRKTAPSMRAQTSCASWRCTWKRQRPRATRKASS